MIGWFVAGFLALVLLYVVIKKRRMRWPVTPRPELDRLLEAARGYVMTKAEREAQRKSWVIGEMMLDHPEMTREQAEAIYAKVTE